jgi:cardiolipin synthase A/B
MKRLKIHFTIALVLIFGTACCSSFGSQQPSDSKLQVFVEPDAGYRPVLDALNASHESILMEMYLLTDKNIIDSLKRAKSRGVNVQIMLEKWAYRNAADFEAICGDLNSHGISVQLSDPAFRLTHEKSIVIDHRVAFIMTINQDHTAYTKNREFGIIDNNPSDVAEIVTVFEDDWNRTTPVLSDPNLVWSPVNSREKIIGLIDGAKTGLAVENEEMQDQEVEDHLIAAAQRGVNVRVVMSPSSSVDDANNAGRDRIEKGGAKVRLLAKPYIHAKLVIADGASAFVGSENFSPTSIDHNRELGILVSDPKIVQTLSTTFAKDWIAGKVALKSLRTSPLITSRNMKLKKNS